MKAVCGTIEDSVSACEKTEDFFVEKLFRKDGGSLEEAKERLNDHM